MNTETSSPGMDDSHVNTLAAKDYRGPSQNISTAAGEGASPSARPATFRGASLQREHIVQSSRPSMTQTCVMSGTIMVCVRPL